MSDMSDKEIVPRAIGMWRNYIETGTVTMSAVDMKNCGKASEVKALRSEQAAFVERLNKLQYSVDIK